MARGNTDSISKQNVKPDDGGFYCYIGPNIPGLIQSGQIYMGTREAALLAASAAIERFPLVKTLLVSGTALPEARLKVKKPGNALYANYQKIAAEREEKRKGKQVNG